MLPVPVGVVQRRGCQETSQLPCCLYTREDLQPGGHDERCQSDCMPGNPTHLLPQQLEGAEDASDLPTVHMKFTREL